MKNLFLVAMVIMALLACEKVVDVDLNSAESKLIIEGNITNDTTIYQVKLSRTVNFSESNSYPPVSGALVTITDKAGNSMDTLSENQPGVYSSHFIQGIFGHTYDLFVRCEGQIYTASSTMPLPVTLDSIVFEHTSNQGTDSVIGIAHFQDPKGIANNYVTNQFVNGKKIRRDYVFDDRLSDGRYIKQRLFGSGSAYRVGDAITVQMKCVDSKVWKYFNTLTELNGGGFASPSPANPSSNISNNALGYFSAHAVQSMTAIAHY